MAAYAATQMSGQALRWHMGLPRDVRSDWIKLEVALLDRFAPDELPAAQPMNNPLVPSGAPVEPTLCTGRIRLTEHDTGRFVGYLSKNTGKTDHYGFSVAPTSTRADDALLVEFRPSSHLVTFDLVDKSTFHRLALRLRGERLELHDPETRDFEIICLAPGPKPGSIRYSSPTEMGVVVHVQHAVWKVGVDGSITPVWPKSPEVEIGGSIIKPPANPDLSLVSNMTGLMKEYWYSKKAIRVKLEFEDA
ncbi:hypothetical protein FRC01_012992 [Tulasnella sp. 417]|nr:hypothetical protein FRC01_012992 [Tulasnella sp. 417]